MKIQKRINYNLNNGKYIDIDLNLYEFDDDFKVIDEDSGEDWFYKKIEIDLDNQIRSDDMVRKSVLDRKKGYIKNLFTTQITNATDIDVENAELYGKELLSDYLNINIDFIKLDFQDSKRNNTFSNSYKYIFEVLGQEVGNLIINIQNLDKVKNITFIANAKTNMSDYNSYLGKNKYNKLDKHHKASREQKILTYKRQKKQGRL